MSHIQLKYAFLLFWSILGDIHNEILFLVGMWLSQNGALKYSESFFFNTLEKGQILRKIWICLNNCFWSNP